MKAILPHIDRENADPNVIATGTAFHGHSTDSESSDDEVARGRPRSNNETVPAFPFGFVFMRPIRIGGNYPVPRLVDMDLWIPPQAFTNLFKVSFENLAAEFFHEGSTLATNSQRVPNKVKRTQTWENQGQAREGNLFELSRRGVRLQSPPLDDRSDNSVHEIEDDSEDAGDIDEKPTSLWHQFLLDITSKAPNPRSATQPPYCRLTEQECKVVNEGTYKNTKLSVYFKWKIATTQEWCLVFGLERPRVRRILSEGGDRFWDLGNSYDT